MDYLDGIGRGNIARHDQELGAYAFEQLSALPGIRLFGPTMGRAGLVSFLLDGVHAHDVVTVADRSGVALRGGHHCNQPLMKRLGVESGWRQDSLTCAPSHWSAQEAAEDLRLYPLPFR